MSQEFFAKTPFFKLDLQETSIFLKTHTKRSILHNQTFYSVPLAFLAREPIFVGGVFQKILIFLLFLKNGVFPKNSWLNFLTNNVFTINTKLLTILLELFVAIFSES